MTIDLRHAPPRRPRIDRAAVRDILPVVAAVGPFGVVVGVATTEADIAASVGLPASFLLYGGTIQLAMVALVAGGSGVATAALGAAVVNARLLLYSASLASLFRAQPAWFRWIAPHFLVDQTAALAARHLESDEPAAFRRYWLTCAAVLTLAWLACIGAGMTLGPRVSGGSPLEVTTAALFVALLVPRLVERPGAVAAGAAALTAALTAGLPGGVGIPLSIGAGVAAASVVAGRGARS